MQFERLGVFLHSVRSNLCVHQKTRKNLGVVNVVVFDDEIVFLFYFTFLNMRIYLFFSFGVDFRKLIGTDI